METKILENVRFRHLYAGLDIWKTANPIILSGELALVKDDNNRMKIKIGTGMSFNDTAYLYSMDRWTNKYKDLTAADDANIKPSDAKGYNTEDFLQISGDLIYPINLTTSVRLKDGTKLQTWMDNVDTGHVTMTGNLRVNRTVGGVRDILKVLTDDAYGTSIALGSGGNTVVSSGEADVLISPLLNPNSEQLYLASDQSMFLYTKCQTADTMRNIVFNGDAFYPGSNNNIDLGASSYRWSHIYTYSIDVDNVFSARHVSLKTNNTTDIKGIGGLIGNDYWRVGGALSDADNVDSGYMEIATADNGTEPIYARQYIGGFTTLVRTLTLLDASGNSLFPGSISEKGVTLEDKYLQRSGALPMTGSLDMGMHHSIRFRVNGKGGSAVGNAFRNSDDSVFGGIGVYGLDGVAEYIYLSVGTEPWDVSTGGVSISATQFKYKNNTIWHAGNDGANSGLDADLLDGKHASAFSLTSHTHSYAGSASVGGPANSALKLQTARKIGNASFDGTADITIAQMGVSPEAGSDKLSKLAQTITLGYGSNATILQDNGQYRQKIEISDLATDTSSVFTFSRSTDSGATWTELLSITGESTIKAKQFTGNSATATKLQTVRKIGNANFDGSANITVEQIGAAPTVHGHNILDASAFVTTSGSAYLNNYAKVSEYKLKDRYASVSTTFECIVGSHGETKNDYFRLHVWIKQQEALELDPYIYISSSGRDNTTKRVRFYAQIDEKTSTYTKVSLYAKVLANYTSMRMVTLADSSSNSDIAYFKNEAFIESLTGSGKIIEEIDCSGKHLHTKSQITDFPTSIKNPTNLVVKLNSGTVEGTNMFTYDGSVGKSFNITPETVGARPAGAIALDTGIDLNTILIEGEYFAMGGNKCVNKPSNINAFSLRVQRTASAYFAQILIGSDALTNKMYIRTYNGAQWTEWESLYSTKYKPSPTDVGAAPAVHTHPYLPLAGGTMTGNICIAMKSNPTGGSAKGIWFRDPIDSTIQLGEIGVYCAKDEFKYIYIGTGAEAWRGGTSLTISETDIGFHGNKVWHAGNDGAGSGLDADLLDGLEATAFAKAVHTHTKAQITDFPVSLKNPNALTISLNGTSQGAYDGSAAKVINITPISIGAAAASHTHTKSQITDFPTTLPNAGALTISLNGTSQGAYDGSAAKAINITAASVGAAATSHTHNYAGSSSVGGNANAAVKLATARKIGNANFDGTANITVEQIGAAAASHTHDYLPLTGGTVRGLTIFEQGTSAFHSIGENGKAGYILMAEIKILEAYQNVPIIFEVINRSANRPMTVSLLFNNSDGSDPTVNSFTYSGHNREAYIHRASAGTWNLYIKKSEAYDSVCISRLVKHKAYGNIKITWKGTLVTTLPDGCVTATLHTIASTATKLATARKIGNASFDGTADITVAQIGASAVGHTHNYAGSSSAGGNANAAVKLATARKIGNASFDGTADITVAAIGAAAASHSHSYLPLSGGTMTGTIISSLLTNTYLEGNKGKAIINSSATAGGYTMLAKLNSTNGYFTDGVYQDKRLFQYTPKTTVDAETNSVAKSVTILNEAGNSIFPGTVTAPTFSGSLSGTASAATKLATARKIGNIAFDGTADITVAQIGAAAASHTHTKAQITDFPASLKNPTALTISLNGTSQGAYDGSTAKSINITAASVGAAVISHTHNYAGSSSAGGNANAAVKLATARKIGNASFDGTANITAAQMGVAPSNLIYKNITITTSAWNSSTKIYEYANASITANHVPQVFFSNASLDAAGKAGIIVYTEAGKLVLKCTTIPTVSLVIETAILTPV